VKFRTILLFNWRDNNFYSNFGLWKGNLLIHIVFWVHFLRNGRAKFITLSIGGEKVLLSFLFRDSLFILFIELIYFTN
jgi:hypothetical protein